MKKAFVKLVSIDDVKDFVKEANKLECEAELSLGKYTVDAKSIMGIFSLDLSRSLELTVHDDNSDFIEKIDKFIVK